MKHILSFVFIFYVSIANAQFSAYDGFDDNSSGWLIRNDDSAHVFITGSKLDATVKYTGDFLDAKGAVIDSMQPFRSELSMGYVSGDLNIPYGICWGAGDINNYHLFYITAEGKFGFKTMKDNVWKDVVPATSNPMINKSGYNWLRVNAFRSNGVMKLDLCINELIVKTIDYVIPFGSYYGIYIGGKEHVLFDDFIVYQRGKTQEEFEPSDLSLSAKCKYGQLNYSNSYYKWSTCVPVGTRIDEDSTVCRFWYTDSRTGDYSIIVAPMTSIGNVEFTKACEQDLGDYLAEGDSIVTIGRESITRVTTTTDYKVYQLGATYTAPDLDHNLYIRRYYVERSNDRMKGICFQFIVPQHSPYLTDLDEMIKQIITSSEFN